MTLILRNKQGSVAGQTTLSLADGCQIAEFVDQRFPGVAKPGFTGSLEIRSDQNVAAIALRYDNVHLSSLSQVFSSIPVLLDESSKTLYFPQSADGGGYRSNILLLNPQDTAATNAKMEFFNNDGMPQSIPIDGQLQTSFDVPLAPKGVARVVTDGISPDLKVAWVKVTSAVPIYGSAIFQTIGDARILSEAGVSSSPLMQHFIAYASSLGTTESGIAICNPASVDAVIDVKLRESTGKVAASTQLVLPPRGHIAKFFTEWFPNGYGEFEGSIEFSSSVAVAAVALRFDNPTGSAFATVPVFEIR